MTTVTIRYDGRVFVPEEPVDLPIGYRAEIPLPTGEEAPPSERPLLKLLELMKRFPDDPRMPCDAAAEHDHYLYGTPKKNDLG